MKPKPRNVDTAIGATTLAYLRDELPESRLQRLIRKLKRGEKD